MSNKSCRDLSSTYWGVQANDRRRIDSYGATGTANPDSYNSHPVPVHVAPAMQKPKSHGLPAAPTRGYPETEAQPSQSPQPEYHQNSQPAPHPQRQAILVTDFNRIVTEYAQRQQQEPKRKGQTTYHMGMTQQAMLVLWQESRAYYLKCTPGRLYEDVIDRMEAAYLVLVERHKALLSHLHKSQQQQLGLSSQVLQIAPQQFSQIEAEIERLNAIRWESVNHQTAAAQNQFDAALRRGPANDGIIAALDHGTELIESNGKQVSITGQHWARDKYKSALAELALTDPQECIAFWQHVNHVRLEIPHDWNGRYDGETLPNGVITCNPYISQQRMIGNTVHNTAHSGDRHSQTREQSESYAAQREMAMWNRQGKSNMKVFA